MITKCAVVQESDDVVINIIIADPDVDPPPLGCILIDVANTPCDIGWIYDPATGTFSPPSGA